MGGYANPCFDQDCALEGRHEVHEREPTPQAGIVLIVRQEPLVQRQVLVTTNRHYGQYSLPGGKTDPTDPSPRFTAIRELREETSLVALDSDLTFLFKAKNQVSNSEREVHVFFARVVWGKPKNLEKGTSFDWFTFPKLLESSLFAPFYKEYLPDGIDHLISTSMSPSQ